MAKFDTAIPHTLAWEGGYVNHKADPGGETNHGITDRLDGKVDGLVDIDGDGEGDVSIKGLTEDQAKQVYKEKFWNKMRGDEIHSQHIAAILFDGYVNMGSRAIKIMQRLLLLTDDGLVGDNTLRAINHANEVLLYTSYKAAREIFYRKLVEQKPELGVFLKGWMNRLNSFPDL
jgi:lysozyme family protein